MLRARETFASSTSAPTQRVAKNMPAATATDDTQQMAARCVDEQQPHLAQTLLPKALVPLTGPAGTGSDRGSQMCAMLA